MSKLTTVAVILAVAAVTIGAKQMTSEAKQLAPAASVAPIEMMINVGPLPETQVSAYF